MTEKRQDIVFRRIGGRIVPIKKKPGITPSKGITTKTHAVKKKKESSVSGSLFKVVSGIGLGVLGGYAGANIVSTGKLKLLRRAEYFRVKADRGIKRGNFKAFKNIKKSRNALFAAKAAGKVGFGVQTLGFVLGSGIASTGFSKLFDKMGLENETSREIASYSAGAATLGASNYVMKKVLLKKAYPFLKPF